MHIHIHIHILILIYTTHTSNTCTYAYTPEASRSFSHLSCGSWAACAIEDSNAARSRARNDALKDSHSGSDSPKSESDAARFDAPASDGSGSDGGAASLAWRQDSGNVVCWGDADIVDTLPSGLLAKQVRHLCSDAFAFEFPRGIG